MEKSRRVETTIAALRWIAVAGGLIAAWGCIPAWRITLIAALVTTYSVVGLWLASDEKRFRQFGRKSALASFVLDFIVVTAMVADTSARSSPVYALYWFLILCVGVRETRVSRLLAVTGASLVASILATAYALRGLPNPSLFAETIGIRSAVIAFAFPIAVYISSTRSREQLVAERGSYLTAILKCGTQLTSCGNVQDLGFDMLKTLVSEIGAAGAQLLLRNEETGELECQAACNSEIIPESESSGEIPVHAYARWVVNSGRDFLMRPGGKLDEDAAPTQADRPVMATPLRWQTSGAENESHVLGVLVVWGSIGRDFDDDALEIIRILAAISSAAIVNLRLYMNMQKTFVQTLQSLANSLEARDEYTQGHSERVMQVACMIAESLGVRGESLDSLRNASLLHDIGKIGIPDAILKKAGKLTSEEWESMRRHPVVSEEICRPLGLGSDILFLIKHHHERLDAKGYPAGLQAQEQPLLQRILVASDAFDAMRSRRPYRDPMSKDDIRVELHRSAGRTMDPTVVDALMKLMDSEEMDSVYQKHDQITNILARGAQIPEQKAA